MSLAERTGQLKERLASIYEESAQKDLSKKQASQKAKEEEEQQAEKRLKEQRLANENWSSIREQALEVFQTINRKVLDGEGQIVGWKTRNTSSHRHDTSLQIRGASWDRDQTTVTSYYLDTVEVAELGVRNVGKIALFRSVKRLSKSFGEKRFSNEKYGADRVFIGFLSEAWKKRNRGIIPLLCHKCNNVSSLSLVQPLGEIIGQIEEAVSEKLIALHEETLLG